MIKQNINKIHYDITNEFEVVTLSEKFNRDLGSYIEISITEGKKEVKLTLKKTEVEKNSFDWSYLSNPLVESSDLVYRTSTVLEFSRDIKDIFEKNRFDSDYLEEIKKKNDINENKALSQTSVTSRLCTLELNYNTEVDLKLSDEGEIEIISTDSYHAGLGYTHKIDIIANEKTSLEKIHIDWRDNLGQTFCSALLDKGVYARVIGENNAYMSKYKIKYSFENPYKEVFDSLKEMVREGRSNFRFSQFVKVEKNNLIVKFVGHEVGGSYTPESKVTPLYIEKIQHKTSKKVKFIERLSGGFGYDIYVFSINLKSSFKPNRTLGSR